MQEAHVPDRLIARIVLSAALGALCVGIGLRAIEHEPRYFIVDQLAASGLENHVDTALRVRGFVVPGTIRELTLEPGVYGFMLAYHGVALRVRTRGPLPDTLRDQSEVVVHGRLHYWDYAWIIDADKLSLRCGGKYEGNPTTAGANKFQ